MKQFDTHISKLIPKMIKNSSLSYFSFHSPLSLMVLFLSTLVSLHSCSQLGLMALSLKMNHFELEQMHHLLQLPPPSVDLHGSVSVHICPLTAFIHASHLMLMMSNNATE